MAASRELLFPPTVLILLLCSGASHVHSLEGNWPLVISTWPFREAVRAAWDAVENGLSAVDSVVEGCSTCEDLRCDGTVGPGGSPDENGETALDAMVMDGITMEVGAVASLRFVSGAIRAAKLVLQHTHHTLLVGDQASAFALSMGLPGPMNLSSPESLKKWRKWKQNGCQPNFWKNVLPSSGCGPYHPMDITKMESGHSICDSGSILGGVNLSSKQITRLNHDTISMAVIDKLGHIAVGTSTNGATFKIPGSHARPMPSRNCPCRPGNVREVSKVGDGPIAGSSAYADQDVGACGATGDGDVMMRFLPCYQVVESMRRGMTPKHAALDAISRIKRKYPDFVGAVFAVNMQGIHAGACHGWTFQYSVISSYMDDVEVFTISPENV